MRQSSIHRSSIPAEPNDIEQLLSERYSQLISWGMTLSRGDAAITQDMVQELCLYFTLKKPDLSKVGNIDGYLYTSLRHIYLSGLARASREASRIVNVADFDSFDFVVTSHRGSDPLIQQNELRRICSYAVWRKEKSKSASYFILHFFHGYSRQEIADLARLPISAIYNKLKLARSEVKSHLQDDNRLRLVDADAAPPAPQSWTLLSANELFIELRTLILSARMRECLPQEQLLEHYSDPRATPISCPLLSHIVSCPRCLSIIDSHLGRPSLSSREPFDSIDSPRGTETHLQLMKTLPSLERVRRRSKWIFEHRPNTLSIALNGRIIASHDVQSPQSTLSARVASPEKDQFIEVFSEQDVRLALLSIENLPPEGPTLLEQRIDLSDARWLTLLVTFDGQGLHSEVTYFDDALHFQMALISREEDGVETVQGQVATPWAPSREAAETAASTPGNSPIRWLKFLVPSSAFAWAITLALTIGCVGYLVLRQKNKPLDARAILDQSVQAETIALRGHTEHQLVRVEEILADGKTVPQGTLDVWKDSDNHRYIRRFYDPNHRLVAASWKSRKGEPSRLERSPAKAHGGSNPLVSEVWDQDLSATAFKQLGGRETLAATPDGYELTTAGPVPNGPHIRSTTLILDKNFVPVQQIFTMQTAKRTRQVRLTRISLERRTSASVPDSVFEPDVRTGSTESPLRPSEDLGRTQASEASPVRLAELRIAVLYQLSKLGADVGEPIELTNTANGRVSVSGSVADPTLRARILESLMQLKDGEWLDLHLSTSNGLQSPRAARAVPSSMSVFEVETAKPMIEPLLRQHLQSKSTQVILDTATAQYEQSVLQQSQGALQNSYALNRLANVFSDAELSSINGESRAQWAEMVEKHSDQLLLSLKNLHHLLAFAGSASAKEVPARAQHIEDAEQFATTASDLLHRVQSVNRDLGVLFTANTTSHQQDEPATLLQRALSAIPLRPAEEINRFSQRLSHSTPPSFTDNTEERHERK